jgi:hypothetical protein
VRPINLPYMKPSTDMRWYRMTANLICL